jgi:hypothetical protein
MNHSFDTEHAELYGVYEAVFINNFSHWIAFNRAEGRNFIDGRTWSYNSVEAFGKLYPYLTTWQIRSALKKLVDAGVLVVDNFNKHPRDQTRWYAFAEEDRFVPLPRADAEARAEARAAEAAREQANSANVTGVDSTLPSAKPSAHLRNSTNGNSNGAGSQSVDSEPSAHLRKTTNGPSAHLRKTTNAFVENHKSTLCTDVNTDIKNNARAGALAADWALPVEWGQWAKENFPHWSDRHVEVVAASFHAHWQQGGERDDSDKKASWQSRWRAWCREAPEPQAEDEPPSPEVAELKNWFLSEDGVKAQAAALGMTGNVGETLEAFKERIKDRLAGKKPKKQKARPPEQFPQPVSRLRPNLPPEEIDAHLQSVREAIAKGNEARPRRLQAIRSSVK